MESFIDISRHQAVKQKVDSAMQQVFRLEVGDQNGEPCSDEHRKEILTILFGQIYDAVGAKRFLELPPEALDQFAVMSLVKNHDTQGLLSSLINSFMIAYLTPETSDEAFKCLEKLEGMRKEIGDARLFKH